MNTTLRRVPDGPRPHRGTAAWVRQKTWQPARSRRSVPTTSGACSGRRTSSTPAPDTRRASSTTTGLRAVEDTAIRDVVALQREAGVRTATDGEFRRSSWHMDFIYQLEGVDPTDQKLAVHFHNKDGDLDFEAAALSVHDRIGLGHTIFGDAFEFLQGVTDDGPGRCRS